MNTDNQAENRSPDEVEAETEIRALFARRDRDNPIRETLTISTSTHPDFCSQNGQHYPFIRLASIPEKYRLFVLRSITGSACPAPDDKRDAFYETDVVRILRVAGVSVRFVANHKAQD